MEKQLLHICMKDSAQIETFVFQGKMDRILEICKLQYDYILLDVKAIANSGFSKKVCKTCDENLIIVSQDVEEGPELGRAIHQLQEIGVKVSGVVMNEYHAKKVILKM